MSIQCIAVAASVLGDDVQLDGASGSACDFSFTYYFSSSRYTASTQGSQDLLDFDTDVYYRFYVEKAVDPPRSRTIIINSTEENTDLYVVGANNYRYNADDQVYMLYLQVSGSSAHFVNGMNVVIIPRHIALDSKFNDVLKSAPSSSELSGGEFYSTDMSQSSSSANIIAVMSKSMSASQAEALLTKLTHNSANERIGNSVVISQSNIYLLGLPADVMSRIPYSLTSDPIGTMPNYINIGDVLAAVVNIFISIGTALYNFANNLYQAGVKLICEMVAPLSIRYRAP